ncbi:hypothetical protein [Alteromonas australica]|jgi:hypothetical protein|uniref:hypothetical protein n=1 Tax=Alteromonas australica TaxID=589873 RepID=UPI0035C8038B
MPRAVLISVGELSLKPIKTLVEANNVTVATIAVSDTASLKTLESLTNKLSEQEQNAECLLVQALNGVEQSVSAFDGVSTHLVYSSPETYVTQRLAAAQSELTTDAVIQLSSQQYIQHVKSALHAFEQDAALRLCSLDDILGNPTSFIKTVFHKDCQDAINEPSSNLVYQTTALSATAALVNNDEIFELYDDALSVGQLFGEFSVHLSPDSDTFKSKSSLLNEVAKAILQKNKQIATLNQNVTENKTQLAEKDKALINTNEVLAAQQQEFTALQQRLEAKAKELESKTNDVNATKEKLSEKENQNNQLTQQLAEQETAALEKSNALRGELESQEQALAKVSQELTAKDKEYKELQQCFEAKAKELDEKVKDATSISAELNDKDIQCKKLAQQLEEHMREAELSQLQMAQLKEELEASIQKNNKLEQTEQALKASKEKVLQLQNKLTDVDEDAQLASLQVTQLQEELEHVFTECEALKTKEQETEKSFKKQASILQRELEQVKSENQALEDALQGAQQKQEEREGASEVTTEKLQNTELELELASLQISQLQEELEHYYLTLQESERSLQKGLTDSTMTDNKIRTKAFDKVNASELSVTGKYAEGDYQDIHLTLHNIKLVNGKQLESLNAKLVNVSGHIGIEFRAQENENLFREFEDSKDEYGCYLRYFLSAPENLQAQQVKTVERLNASERLLIMSSINAIAELLQNKSIKTDIDVTPEQWRAWRKVAIELSHHVDSLPNWLSFDSVQLREEFVTDGYEHLWLVFNGVLIGNVWRNTLELKLTANEIGKAQNGEFSDVINIEFRELEDGSAPLMAWPPEVADEYGPKLNIAINNLVSLNEFTIHDRQLLTHLVNNFPSILEKLEVDESDMSRSKLTWISAIAALQTDEIGMIEKQTPLQSKEETPDKIDTTLTCEEAVSVGSYQHLVFTQKGNETKIKLMAENVNSETFDAEVYLELRDGTNNVIYNDSEYFGEDEFGPRVKIPAETLQKLLKENELDQYSWVVSVYQDIPKYIDHAVNLDELGKLLWQNTLNRKSEK